MTRTQNYWKRLTSTLWFIPALMTICGVLLGLVLVSFDYNVQQRGYFFYIWRVQPSAARDMLAVVSGSMISVAGTVFSITIVALALASTQFSPRILRNFMRDRGNQFVLGAFAGIFAYCLIVLRTIREKTPENDAEFFPTVAFAVGVLFGLSGIGFLLYFIHHVAATIQATTIIRHIADETIAEIEEKHKLSYDARQYDAQTIDELQAKKWIKITCAKTGYIQNAEINTLFKLARKYNLIVQMRRRIGEFTIKGLPLLQVSSANGEVVADEKLIAEFNEAYYIGDFRTVEGDVAFGLRQIVDIALKALSPAVNDTTTGISCIDYLTAILITLSKRPSRPPLYFHEDKLRLVVKQQLFEDYFDLSFNQIRQNAEGNVAIILRLLNAMEVLGKSNQNFHIEDERLERHDLLETQTRLLFGMAERTVRADTDLQTVRRYYEHVEETLKGLR